ESGVTYTDISSPFEELSDIGSPRADDHVHFELPEMLEDPYVESPEYVPESDLEVHPEDDDDEDPEEDSVDYLADGGDDGDDEEGSSEDDEDDDMDIEVDEEEDEHPAPTDSVVVASTAADHAPSIMRDPEREVGYGITDSWDEIVKTLQGAPVSTDTELGGYMREFDTRVRQDTDEIYMRLDDEQTERQLLAGRLNMLFKDRRTHAYTRHLMETEARMSREA
nr:hypothetical protein [Tanacetum cinerariifolium]